MARDERPYWARATLIVRRYSPEAVEAALNQFVRSLSGANWDELALKLNRFLHWEFENYEPRPAVSTIADPTAAFACQEQPATRAAECRNAR